MYLALRLVHLMSAAVWFGATLIVAGDVRRSVELGGAAARAMIDRVRRTLVLSSAAGATALASGLGLVFFLGGFRSVPARIHAGFGLSLLALAIEVSVLGAAFRRITDGVTQDDSQEARGGTRQFAGLTGVLHLLRAVVFALMVLRF